jgi:4-methylaminobutanoate oxidase (formaldehyde-forming)
VGVVGWVVLLPIGDTGAVFVGVVAAGAAHGMATAGYRAIESLRLEKGYRAWGQDITPGDNPLEAGLGWALKLKSGIAFHGRAAIDKAMAAPLRKRLSTFTVADPAILLSGRETILRDGRPVGYLSSGGWGYTVNANVGLGYVRNPEGVTPDFHASGRYELEVASERVPALLAPGAALYDPGNARVKA